MNLAPQTQEETPYPKPARAWYVLGLLTLAYVVSMIDRTILFLLVGPIRRDLHISDTQMILLMGFTFGMFYTFFGIILGACFQQGAALLRTSGRCWFFVWELEWARHRFRHPLTHFLRIISLPNGALLR